MEPRALQELIKQVFSDEKTRAEFASDPDKVISRYPLTAEEKRAVLATHARLGLVTAGYTRMDTIIGPMSIWH